MTATQQRSRASLEELQAAAEAARRGEFALRRPATGAATAAAASAAARIPAPVAPAPSDTSGWQSGGAVVAVVAGHSGAGASTVAVALAEALAAAGSNVWIVEVADASRSGLAGATTAELGEDGTGWRRGRRSGPWGDIHIDRLAFRAAAIEQVPAPAPAPCPDELLVLDIGWPARDALAALGWLATALTDCSLLMVCRPTVPGVRQSEYLLAELAEHSPGSVIVAAVGPARWPGAATASTGPHLRAARESGRVITVPIDRRVETDGVSAEALPKALAAAGKALAAALPSTAAHDHLTDQSALGRAG
ncbi:MAG: hypothetical protein J0H43_07880 [Actinobacteria bacterium]|nr:hypothetical protein [Actinomycetota bacterium]